MSDVITAAVVQASWRRLATAEDVRRELKRYLRLVRNKGADLVVLPEQFGLMLAIPLAGGLRGTLVKNRRPRICHLPCWRVALPSG